MLSGLKMAGTDGAEADSLSWRTGLNVDKRSVSLPPSRDVLPLMAALACGYDPR